MWGETRIHIITGFLKGDLTNTYSEQSKWSWPHPRAGEQTGKASEDYLVFLWMGAYCMGAAWAASRSPAEHRLWIIWSTVGHRSHLKGCWDDLGFLAQHWPHSIEVLVSDFSIKLFCGVQLELLGFRREIFPTLTLLLRGKLLRREFHISYQMQRNDPYKDWNFITGS